MAVKQDATNDSYSADSAGFEDDVSHKVLSKQGKKESASAAVMTNKEKIKSVPASKKGKSKDETEYSDDDDDYSDMSAPEKLVNKKVDNNR